jgi:hypothetical protein
MLKFKLRSDFSEVEGDRHKGRNQKHYDTDMILVAFVSIEYVFTVSQGE